MGCTLIVNSPWVFSTCWVVCVNARERATSLPTTDHAWHTPTRTHSSSSAGSTPCLSTRSSSSRPRSSRTSFRSRTCLPSTAARRASRFRTFHLRNAMALDCTSEAGSPKLLKRPRTRRRHPILRRQLRRRRLRRPSKLVPLVSSAPLSLLSAIPLPVLPLLPSPPLLPHASKQVSSNSLPPHCIVQQRERLS